MLLFEQSLNQVYYLIDLQQRIDLTVLVLIVKKQAGFYQRMVTYSDQSIFAYYSFR